MMRFVAAISLSGVDLFCRDTDLVMKAAAAYEYLGIGTKIYHFQTNNQSKS